MITASSKNSFIKTPLSSVSASSVLLAIVFVALIRRPNKFFRTVLLFLLADPERLFNDYDQKLCRGLVKTLPSNLCDGSPLNKSPQLDSGKCSHPQPGLIRPLPYLAQKTEAS
jgi:hypothetical protein